MTSDEHLIKLFDHPTTFDESRIRTLFNEAIEKSGAVGAQLSLIKGDKQLDLYYGFANAELEIPLTQDTVIQIGPSTKVFNAMLLQAERIFESNTLSKSA